jgi:hypothetical protein
MLTRCEKQTPRHHEGESNPWRFAEGAPAAFHFSGFNFKILDKRLLWFRRSLALS